jgi:hypothetical protein
MGKFFYGFAIDRYSDQPLSSCVRDMNALSQTLKKRFGFTCEEYKDEEVTLTSIRSVLARVVHKRVGDDVIVFFSGHGSAKHSWCVNGEVGDEYFESMELHKFVDRAQTRQLLLISDSCYALGQACKREGVRHEAVLVDELEQADGKWFLAATGDYESWDGGDGLSPFVDALVDSLDELQGPAALQEVFPRVRERCHGVTADPRRKQVPYLRALVPTLHGEFVFRPVKKVAPSVAPPPGNAPAVPPPPPGLYPAVDIDGAALAKVIAKGLGPGWTRSTNGSGHVVFVGERGTHVAKLRLFKNHLRAYLRGRDGGWLAPADVRTESGAKAFGARVTEAWQSPPVPGAASTPVATPSAASPGGASTNISVWRREIEDSEYRKFLAALLVEHLQVLWEHLGEDPRGHNRRSLVERLGRYSGDVAELIDVLDHVAIERLSDAFAIEHHLLPTWQEAEAELCCMLRRDETVDWASASEGRRGELLGRLRKPEIQGIYRALGSDWDPDQPVAVLRAELDELYPGTVGGILWRLPYAALERLIEELDLRVADWNRRTLEMKLVRWLRV